ncbi:uncharacterized protein [Littorina saxatilis]|uniref:uncharacterized protein n=1 Tax=Littorina saxatilis TaxID=31220 RepID=UPI0038B52DDD
MVQVALEKQRNAMAEIQNNTVEAVASNSSPTEGNGKSAGEWTETQVFNDRNPSIKSTCNIPSTHSFITPSIEEGNNSRELSEDPLGSLDGDFANDPDFCPSTEDDTESEISQVFPLLQIPTQHISPVRTKRKGSSQGKHCQQSSVHRQSLPKYQEQEIQTNTAEGVVHSSSSSTEGNSTSAGERTETQVFNVATDDRNPCIKSTSNTPSTHSFITPSIGKEIQTNTAEGVVHSSSSSTEGNSKSAGERTETQVFNVATDDRNPCIKSTSNTPSTHSFITPSIGKENLPAKPNELKGKKPKRPCLYCGEMQSRLPRHLKRKHSDVEAVSSAFKLPKQDKNEVLSGIRKLGILKENNAIKLSGGKNPIFHRERRGTGKDKDLVVCNGCKGFFSKTRIWKHKQTCVENVMSVGSVDYNFTRHRCDHDFVTSEFRSEILDHFRNDEVGKLCQTDKVIVRLGQKLYNKSMKKERRVIMSDMRTLGSLIVQMRKVADLDNLNGEDVVDRTQFEVLSQAVKEMTTNENGSMKAGMKLSVGYLLKKVAKVMKAHYIITSELVKSEEVDRFLAVLDLNWDYIFYTAQLSCEQRRTNLRKPTDMPMEEDIVKLREFIASEIKILAEPGSYEFFDSNSFVRLRNLLIARLTLFNARRGGEPARLTLTDWQDAMDGVWVDPQQVVSVEDPIQQALASSFKLAYQSGKGSRRLVPVLIPNDSVEPIQLLVRQRKSVEINSANIFLFPNTLNSSDHVNGWNAIKAVTKEMGTRLCKPQLLIADKFRHRASTLFSLQDVQDTSTREAFYRHMGHSEVINKTVYQCPLAIRELTAVGGFLQCLDSNNYGKTHAKHAPLALDLQSKHTITSGSTEHPQPPGSTEHPQPPGSTEHPQLSGSTEHPQPPGSTEHPRLSGSTEHPQPSGSTEHPQLSGSTEHPQPPGSTEHPRLSGSTEHPQPSGSTEHPQPPGSTEHPQPSGSTEHPQLSGSTEHPQPPGSTEHPHPSGSTYPNTGDSQLSDNTTRERTYTRWSRKDTTLVIHKFSSFIQLNAPGSTGPLPSVGQMKSFLNETSIFQSLDPKQQLQLLRTKIFNERKKFREQFKSRCF